MTEPEPRPATAADNTTPDVFLDITHLICPMTFVRTKLAIEKMTAGQTLEVRLNEGEPLINVPRSVEEMGHTVESLKLEPGQTSIYRLIVSIA